MRQTCAASILIFCVSLALSRSAIAQFEGSAAASSASNDVAAIWTSEEQMHQYFVRQFIRSSNFGESRMSAPPMTVNHLMRLVLSKQKVGKTALADVPAAKTAGTYGIDDLELIGVAFHETPVAYVTRMHRGNSTNHPTRELIDFERQAITKLRAGWDVVVQANQESRMVIGALRAQQSCLRCHEDYKVGDVLGALEYHLAPAGTVEGLSPAEDAPTRALNTMERFRAVQAALTKASVALQKAPPQLQAQLVEKAQRSVGDCLADVSEAIAYVETHPELNATKVFDERLLGLTDQPASYAPVMLTDFDPQQTYRGTIRTDVAGVMKPVAFGPQDERGVRIDQDGKGISMSMIQTIVSLNKAMAQMTGSSERRPQEIENWRIRIVQDIRIAKADAVAALDYVHDNVKGKPVEATFAGSRVKPTAKSSEPSRGSP